MGLDQLPGWIDNGHVLVAPNGIPVEGEFRKYILSHEWDARNLPLGPSYEAYPAQLHRPDLSKGHRQVFFHNVLWFSPFSGLGIMDEQYIGVELDAAYKKIDILNNALKAILVYLKSSVDE